MKTCVISFSSRADGNCAAIADCVQETLGAEGLTRFDFSGLSVHGCGACHCECFRQREACPYFADDAFLLNEAAGTGGPRRVHRAELLRFSVLQFFPVQRAEPVLLQRACRAGGPLSCRAEEIHRCQQYGPGEFSGRAFRDHVLPGTEPDVCFLRAAAYHRISLDGDLMTCGACPCSGPGLLAGLVMQRPERHAGRQ